MSLPRIAISAGEPAGIGPDITLIAAKENYEAAIITLGDPSLLHQRAKQLGLNIRIETCTVSDFSTPHQAGVLKVLPVHLQTPCETGHLNADNANYVLNVLDSAVDLCLKRQADAMVTGPIQKSILTHQVKNFSGHTEYLAEKTQTSLPVMMLATEGLRVALATTHMPLSDVPKNITKNSLRDIITILHKDLQQHFGIGKPKILVAGLNPHAGEDGHLGKEDMEIILPIVQEFQQQGFDISGPLPADTLFTEKYLRDADAVLAMYHDQGLPVLKYKGFGNAINITLGLPIIRTSVDHGTALELAGTQQVNPQSMKLAIKTAIELSQ